MMVRVAAKEGECDVHDDSCGKRTRTENRVRVLLAGFIEQALTDAC
jgi:hypothetical protein